MGLDEHRRLFFKIRNRCEIIVRKHAFEDYPERGFSEREIIELVRKGNGTFEDNKSDQAIEESFLFFPKDDLGRRCKLVLLIEQLEIEDAESEEKFIIVCSAYRE